MPTVDQRLCQVTLKVKRAKEHVSDLQREVKAFIDTDPYKVGCKINPEGRPVYFVLSAEPTPKVLPLIAGDAIQNLMSALDHLAFQLVDGDTGGNPPAPTRIYFPIADSAAEYPARRDRRIHGAAQATIDAIDALKPYNGGNDDLWILHGLNNVEKHRLLLTVGSRAGGVHLGRIGAREFEKMEFFADKPDKLAATVAAFESMTQYLMPADKGFPLEPGFQLYTDAPDAKCDPKQKFRFDVAINEPRIVESKSLLETIHKLVTTVDGVVTALTPLLKATP